MDETAADVGDDVAMVGRIVDAPVRGARIGVAPGRARRAATDEVARLGRVFVRCMEVERSAPRLLAVVERGEVAAVATVARELLGRVTGLGHHPGHERPRPRLARGAAVPVRLAAGSPVVADPAGERLAAFADAGPVGIAIGLATIDDGRAAEPGPFLPRRQGDAVGRRPFAVATAITGASGTAAGG